MPQIITFLGKGGSGRTTLSIAAAKQAASEGQRVLWVGQSAYYPSDFWSGATLIGQPQAVAANLSVVNLSATQLLEKAWDVIKQLETKYLRTPLLQNVYGQELSVVPGIDGAVALYSLQEYFVSGLYDLIIYDSPSSLNTIRMFAMPDTLSWYIRRFRQVIETSDLWRNAMPILQPVAATVLSMAWTGESLNMPALQEATEMLDRGQKAMTDPTQVSAYVVTSNDPQEIQAAIWLWGSAQQASLAVAGVLVNREAAVSAEIQAAFAPLPVVAIGDTQSMPNLRPTKDLPKPIEIDINARQVKLFLPGFTKQQVKLSQSGPEITIEAGEQRRNILLPAGLRGADVTGAKFQDNYLIISL
jgi:anion-transporting  ArsA/GET3 family ATPase